MKQRPPNGYYNPKGIGRVILKGRHRLAVGGKWERMGALQRDFLIAQGLKPEHALVDIGCGCLRGGVKLIPYLDPGNYYGIDVSEEMLTIGYEFELAAAELTGRLPRDHLKAGGDFAVEGWGRRFDVAWAQSVFTHLPAALLRDCLARLAPAMARGGRFYATIYEVPQGLPPGASFTHHPGAMESFADRDPYHHSRADVLAAADGLPWAVRFLGVWGHPYGQTMVEFVAP